jgi:hypothetical protein
MYIDAPGDMRKSTLQSQVKGFASDRAKRGETSSE